MFDPKTTFSSLEVVVVWGVRILPINIKSFVLPKGRRTPTNNGTLGFQLAEWYDPGSPQFGMAPPSPQSVRSLWQPGRPRKQQVANDTRTIGHTVSQVFDVVEQWIVFAYLVDGHDT